MTKQEIIERCIAAYSEAIEVCSKLELEQAKDWLKEKKLDYGVCKYSRWVLGIFIQDDKWVERNLKTYSPYWADVCLWLRTHPELMQSLTTRLDILKKELSIPE